jgi:hypothetical protein
MAMTIDLWSNRMVKGADTGSLARYVCHLNDVLGKDHPQDWMKKVIRDHLMVAADELKARTERALKAQS